MQISIYTSIAHPHVYVIQMFLSPCVCVNIYLKKIITMNLQELKKKTPSELISQAEKLGIENPSTLRKQEILFEFFYFIVNGVPQGPVIGPLY